MADRRKTKLSLKRKTISSKSLLFNSIGQRQESLQPDVSDKDPETVIVNLSSDSETDDLTSHQNLQPSKRPRFREFEEPTHSGEHGHEARPIQLKQERLPSETSKPSSFLDVDDEDLRKLRMMFLKLQKPRTSIRTLSDLPVVTDTQNMQAPESVKHIESDKESKELSPLPPMCNWCLRRKPVDYSNLYSDIIQQELQASMANRSVGDHQRALQPSVKEDNSCHTETMETGCKSVQIGSTSDEKVEASMQARKTNVKSEEISFSKSNIKLTSKLNNPTLTEDRHKQEKDIATVQSQKHYMACANKDLIGCVKISSFGKQTESKDISGFVKTQPGNVKMPPGNIKTQPGNIKTQPGNIKTQPGNIMTQPGNIMTQPGNIMTQPGNIMTQPGNIKTQPGNIKTQPGNIKTQLGNIKSQPGNIYAQMHTSGLKTQQEKHFSPSPYRKVVQSVGRTNSNKQDPVTMGVKTNVASQQSERKQSVTFNKAVPTFSPTSSTSYKPEHPDSTENKVAFQGRRTGNLDTEKPEATKQESESPDVQCCPLCQTTFDKGATQIDIDGHIAVCLSMSGDDVTW